MKVAYLNSEYPSLSHTFIEREIAGLRRLGVHIQPVSARSASASGRLGSTNAAAAAETIVLQSDELASVAAAARAALTSPIAFLRALVASQRLSPPGLSARVRHLAYVAQGMILARHLKRLDIEHIHVHMANNGAAIAMLACIYAPRLTYSLSIHGSAEFFHVDSWTLAPKVEHARFVRCISHFCRAQIMTWTNVKCWPRLHIVHCGIDPMIYAPRPERSQGPLRLLTVGRLHPIKGYNVLLEACGILAAEGLCFHLTMVGDGPLMEHLRAGIAQHGLAKHVELAGPVAQENIQHFFDRADAMVVSSFMEGVPVVLMEAMAKELGVVSTRVGGIPELVEAGTSGILVDAGSAASLADGIRRYISSPELCLQHGKAGRMKVLSEFAITGTAQGMADLFTNHLDQPPNEANP
ncbi:MAG: glycosyltransferase family 4 protein [Planctomycetota bacterium]|nr:glycosyltransferase family 4 protein [Planctomycetota bacterium]